MKHSIRWRMVSIFVFLVVIVMIINGSMIIYQTKEYEYDLISQELQKSMTAIEDAGINFDQPENEIEEELKSVVDQDVSEDMKAYILDNNGSVLYSQMTTKETRFNTAQVMAAISGNEISEFDEVHLSGENETFLGYAKRIYNKNDSSLVVYILSSTSEVTQKVYNMVKIIAGSVLLAIILSIILAFLFSSFLTKPIIALTKKAREMATGELDNPIEVFSDDEIGELSMNFNKMAASLYDTLAQIDSEKNKMETVIAHMTDGILVFDNFGEIIHFNPASLRMMNVSSIKSFDEAFGGYIQSSFEYILKSVESTQTKKTIRIKEAYYGLNFVKYIDKEGLTKGLICVIQDITEHKKLENIQKEFVANVSHELRTPITTIKSYAETLLEGALDQRETAVRFLNVINKESDRMTSLVQDLLNLSRLDNQKTSFEKKELDLLELLRSCTESYRIHMAKKEQELNQDVPEGQWKVLGDSNRLEQVIKNILSNAVKYSPEGAKITVEGKESPKNYVIRISDTGMGIPEKDLPHIFDRFYRVDKARSRAMGGTGLGLAIAKEIMELNGSDIQVESKVDQGTTFILSFKKLEVERLEIQ